MDTFKLQFGAMVVLGIVLVDFIRHRKLSLLSTKWFAAFLSCAVVNIIFDITTVYMVNHLDTVSPVVNRLCHMGFMLSMMSVSFAMYLYVCILSNRQKRFNWGQNMLRVLAAVVAVVLMPFAPLYYHVGEDGAYSYGPMASICYAAIIFYIIATFVTVLTAKKRLPFNVKSSVVSGVLMWSAIAVYQLLNPTSLVSSAGIMFMVLAVYLSFENPVEYIDTETGTFNEKAFRIVLQEVIGRKKPFQVIHVVFDDMEYVQHKWGYTEINRVLTQLAERLRINQRVRVYHTRANAFCLLMHHFPSATNIIEMLREFQFDYVSLNGVAMTLKFHVNVMEYPKYVVSADEIYDLMEYMRSAYRHNGVTEKIQYLDEDINEQKDYYLTLKKLVEHAVEEKAFDVYYQPIYSNETKKFSSCEALIRLQDKDTLGFVSPEIFIPLAEEMGVIKEVGRIVFEKVCAFASREKLWEKGVDYIEVNLSAIQGMDRNIVKELSDCMQQYGIRPEFMNLEITETASVESGDILEDNMQKLRQLGCKFSMDDFGTGYSNLSQMAKVHFELIKLDKSLIWPCFEGDNADAVVILDNCINMIQHLGMHIVAEGVETKEQAEALTKKGVHYLQGYYFSKPIPETVYVNYLEEHNFIEK